MLEILLLFLFCAFMAVLALGVVVWLIVTGAFLTLDSLLLSSISLTVGLIFAALFAWSVHRGEFQQALKSIRSGTSDTNAGGAPEPRKA